ncbi:MAG: 3-hydroxyacyl-CoA dehydrogenase NAD-binding domain-containing protein [Proteobacteria bacterium]|nr:3-hydroxyacyl-CoA dehydrogenase NAD-binding domain-containing protein [Pseudomonadota bacterium]
MADTPKAFGSYQHWRVKQDDDGIVWLGLDVAGRSVNVLHKQVLVELNALAKQLGEATDIIGLALYSDKANGFCYGADIGEFNAFKTEAEVADHLALVHNAFNQIATLPFPTIALIDGVAVGGGLELALTCDRIIASNQPKTQLGFPEVNLGIMPGFGGSGRAYRRVGMAAVLDLMLSGTSVTSKKAHDIGLVDGVVVGLSNNEYIKGTFSHDSFLARAKEWRVDQKGAKPKMRPVPKTADMDKVISEAMETHLRKSRPDHTPAPFAIIDHVRCHHADPDAMSAAEQDMFPVLLLSQGSRGLRRRFALSDQLRKLGRGTPPIARLHVIGGGVMGGDIAALAALLGVQVSLADANSKAADAAHSRAKALFDKRLMRDKDKTAASHRLTIYKEGAEANKAMAQADFILEAVAEDLAIKQKVLAEAERHAKPEAVLASNTSSISLENIASSLKNPKRFIGMHFFNPAPVMPLVEVIAHGAKTGASGEEAVQRGLGLCQQLKKMPLPCQSAPGMSAGFLVNRALLPYITTAIDAHLGGVAADKIDQALVDFGMPMGPIELADQIGLDIVLAASAPLTPPMTPAVSTALRAHIEAGRLGRKSGTGFYKWDGNKAIRPRERYPLAELASLAESLLQPMVVATRAAVKEGVVASADMADAGMIFGAGFPAFRGGILFWADQHAS